MLNISSQSSPGKVYESKRKYSARHFWFSPRDLSDLPEIKEITPSNDTSLGLGYAPFTKLEKISYLLESYLNSDEMHNSLSWLGSDIKIMAVRIKDKFNFTICIPQIANYVKNLKEYKTNLQKIKQLIAFKLKENKIINFSLYMNTRDNYATKELYLTAIGSSIESGDEGLAGRGNRINGLITPLRPMSMEGSHGKNPVYHIGKVYYVFAFLLSHQIYKDFKIPNQVFLISQSGKNIKTPWVTIIRVPKNVNDHTKERISDFVKEKLGNITGVTNFIVNKREDSLPKKIFWSLYD
jgi:S-adenosylmethionine synthetase